MPAQSNLVIRQATLRMHVPEDAHAVDDEAFVLDWGLEALQAIPW